MMRFYEDCRILKNRLEKVCQKSEIGVKKTKVLLEINSFLFAPDADTAKRHLPQCDNRYDQAKVEADALR